MLIEIFNMSFLCVCRWLLQGGLVGITWGACRNPVILTSELHGSCGSGHTSITWHSCGSHTEFRVVTLQSHGCHVRVMWLADDNHVEVFLRAQELDEPL